MRVPLLTGEDVRQSARSGATTGPTTGLAPGYVQANLLAVPADWAEEFNDFCTANPAPLPLLERTEPGQAEPSTVAPGADIRTDLPRYHVWRDGRLAAEVTDAREVWRNVS